MEQNLNSNPPKWGQKVNGIISVISPSKMYSLENGENINFSHLPLYCAGDCGSIFHFYYHGLDDLLGDNKYMEIISEFSEASKINNYKSISVDITDKKVINSFEDFIKEIQKAVSYKLNLLRDMCYKIQFNMNKLMVSLVVKKDGTVLLYKLSQELGDKVPIMLNPTSYAELLGTIYYFDFVDMNSIKPSDVFLDSAEYIPGGFWVEELFKLNNQKLIKKNFYCSIKKF